MPSNPSTPVRCAECGKTFAPDTVHTCSPQFVPPSPSAAEPSGIPPTFAYSAKSALENWGRHFDWCAIRHTIVGPCTCGLHREISMLSAYHSRKPKEGEEDTCAVCHKRWACLTTAKDVGLCPDCAEKRINELEAPVAGTAVAETQGLPIANGLILVEPSGVLRPEYAWHPAQQGDALAHVSHLNVGRPVGQCFTIEPFFTLSNLQAHRSPRVAEGPPAVREPSEATTLLTEALDLVPRISDDDAMTPALRDWCRKVRSALNAGATP